ncbi:hypothetical protein [Staphylococcus shinii]|uniref:hypothetical protein n=1 Tax=Staphylococcus shinii TaxID=2912228 RepID=UPI00057BEEA7|nr:hypothetical protein [Staphylococcus shinii]
MKYTIQQLEGEFELSRNFTIEYDVDVDWMSEPEDFDTIDDYVSYVKSIIESARVVPDEWAPYTEINFD